MAPSADRARFERWIANYERAWRSPGVGALGALFAEDAAYRTAPFEPAFVGLHAIAALWDAEREGPDEVFAMESEIVAVEGDTGVARVEVHYGDPVVRRYRDVWIVTFDEDGRCCEFEEWPFWPPGEDGRFSGAPG